MRVTVKVRIVWMQMNHRRMSVTVSVGFSGRVTGSMAMPMVLIMYMAMFVLHRPVSMFVLMPLGQVKIQAHHHQHGRAKELKGNRLVEQCDSK